MQVRRTLKTWLNAKSSLFFWYIFCILLNGLIYKTNVMAYVKKISGEQFIFDVIMKELEIVGSGLSFKNPKELEEWKKEHPKWFTEYEFSTKEQYYEWRDYFYSHFYDWQPKRVKKKEMEREFRWCNLCWGLKYGFDYEELYDEK